MLIKIQFDNNKYMYIGSDVIAQSAVDHNVTVDEFKATLDDMSSKSVSSIPQIYKWREEAVNMYFSLLEKAGVKFTYKPEEFLGGSDYEDVNETTLDNNNKSQNKEEI